MNIYAISDLHLSTVVIKPMDIFGKNWENHFDRIREDWEQKVKDDDIVLLPGDFSWAMRIEDAVPDFNLLASLKGKKVILRGNHDYWWNSLSQVKAILPQGFYALQNDVLRFGNILICGTRGWTVSDNKPQSADDKKIYLREIERLRLSLNAMQKERKDTDTVIGMTHFPPFNAFYDESELINLFVKYDVPTVVYGHLHGKDCRADLNFHKFGINFYLTSCDLVDLKLTKIL